ncbi:MAG: glycosyltransferase family 2 protein, partial [Acidobacteriota bacterium]
MMDAGDLDAVSEGERPLVTVITAAFNVAGAIAACMESVRAQGTGVEHVIVDGASRDGTVEVVREHAGPGVRWVSEADGGIYDAWNKGLRMARGEWIGFLGADDAYVPGAIEEYRRLAKEHPEAEYLSGQVRWVGAGGGTRLIGEPWRWPRFQRFMCVAHVGSLHRRSLFERYGEYDTSYRMVADYEFLLRARGSLRTAYLPHVTVVMQGGGATDSAASLDDRRTGSSGGCDGSMVGEGEVLWAAEVGSVMRERLKRWLPRGLVRAIRERREQWITEYAQKSYSQEGEDLLLDSFVGDRANGFYVDVGAFHPSLISNTQ